MDLTTIGLFSLVALPYSLKFLWAPLVDRWVPPFLGRRRGWILLTQLALLLVISWMAFQDPGEATRLLVAIALLIALFAATQDVAIDAYRTDVLDEHEMGAGAALWVVGLASRSCWLADSPSCSPTTSHGRPYNSSRPRC